MKSNISMQMQLTMVPGVVTGTIIFAVGGNTSPPPENSTTDSESSSKTTDLAELFKQAADAAVKEILIDIEQQHVPSDVQDFSFLHDYVDANMYGLHIYEHLMDWSAENEKFFDFANHLQAYLDAWLGLRKEFLSKYVR